MTMRFNNLVPFLFAALVMAAFSGGTYDRPGYGSSIASAVNDQTGIMKCAKGKHYNTRTRTCDPD